MRKCRPVHRKATMYNHLSGKLIIEEEEIYRGFSQKERTCCRINND